MVGYPDSASAERGPGFVFHGSFFCAVTLAKSPPGKLQLFFYACVRVRGDAKLELHLGLFYWALSPHALPIRPEQLQIAGFLLLRALAALFALLALLPDGGGEG